MNTAQLTCISIFMICLHLPNTCFLIFFHKFPSIFFTNVINTHTKDTTKTWRLLLFARLLFKSYFFFAIYMRLEVLSSSQTHRLNNLIWYYWIIYFRNALICASEAANNCKKNIVMYRRDLYYACFNNFTRHGGLQHWFFASQLTYR